MFDGLACFSYLQPFDNLHYVKSGLPKNHLIYKDIYDLYTSILYIFITISAEIRRMKTLTLR